MRKVLNYIEKYYKIFIKSVNNFVNNFFNNVLNKNLKEKIIYFLNNFKFYILGLFLVILVFYFHSFYKNNYRRDKITYQFINSNYVANAVAINKTSFLTSFDSIEKNCKLGKSRYFVLSNKGKTEVYLSNYDRYKNLAILIANKNVNLNFVIFAKNLSGSVYMSKTNNNFSYKYYKFILKKNKDGYIFLKTLDFLRDYSGESLINKNLEFVGIVNYQSSFLFSKKVIINDLDIVKQFLNENRVSFVVNNGGIDLSYIRNYLNDINYKLVCFEELKSTPPTLIRISK